MRHTSNLRKRTPAERAAIDARAAAWQRPLSKTQREALVALSMRAFVCTVAGWGPAASGGLGAFPTRTIDALARMGYVRVYRRGKPTASAKITGAGRTMARVC